MVDLPIIFMTDDFRRSDAGRNTRVSLFDESGQTRSLSLSLSLTTRSHNVLRAALGVYAYVLNVSHVGGVA